MTSAKKSRRRTRKRVTSINSAGSSPSDNDSDEDDDDVDGKSEDEDEDLPDVSFGRVFGMNKPELSYIICKFKTRITCSIFSRIKACFYRISVVG